MKDKILKMIEIQEKINEKADQNLETTEKDIDVQIIRDCIRTLGYIEIKTKHKESLNKIIGWYIVDIWCSLLSKHIKDPPVFDEPVDCIIESAYSFLQKKSSDGGYLSESDDFNIKRFMAVILNTYFPTDNKCSTLTEQQYFWYVCFSAGVSFDDLYQLFTEKQTRILSYYV